MLKIFLGIAMLITGFIGLACTVCGAIFGMNSAIFALIGFVPGALFLWLTYYLYQVIDRLEVPRPDAGQEQDPPTPG